MTTKLTVEELTEIREVSEQFEFTNALKLLQHVYALGEEIESLRSQLAEAWSPEEFDKKEEHWKSLIRFANGQTEKATHDLKQAEQERDEWEKEARLQYRLFNEYQDEMKKVVEANTAMREDIEQLIDDYSRRANSAEQILEDPNSSSKQKERVKIKSSEYRKIRDSLRLNISRYPKEGDATCETDTAKR